MGAANDQLGHAAHQESRQSSPPMTAQHDQIAIVLLGQPLDLRGWVTLGKQILDVDVSFWWFQGEQALTRSVRVVVRGRQSAELAVRGRRQLMHVRDQQTRMVIMRQRRGELERMLRTGRKISGEQDGADWEHGPPPFGGRRRVCEMRLDSGDGRRRNRAKVVVVQSPCLTREERACRQTPQNSREKQLFQARERMSFAFIPMRRQDDRSGKNLERRLTQFGWCSTVYLAPGPESQDGSGHDGPATRNFLVGGVFLLLAGT